MSDAVVYLDAIGVDAPGLSGWDVFSDALRSDKDDISEDWSVTPACLSPRQSKRLSETTRLALACAEQIGDTLQSDAGWVFASSLGEGLTLDVILNALAKDEILISPMKFQNAVHNAAVGQWTIAKGLQGPSTSIAAFDQTAGAGMLKAWLQCTLEQIPVGLVVYDWPLSQPLQAKRPIAVPLGLALGFSPVRTRSSIRRLVCRPGQSESSKSRTALGKTLVTTLNPAAALVPLLELLADEAEGIVTLALSGGSGLDVEVTKP